MKLKHLAAACSLLCASQAFALVPGVDPIDVKLKISGSSAQAPGLTSALTGVKFGFASRPNPSFSFCLEGTDTVYVQNSNNRAVFCKFKNAADIPVSLRNKNVVVIKRDNGGSGYGIWPTFNQAVPPAFQSGGEVGPAIKFLRFDQPSCTQTVAPTLTVPGTGTCNVNQDSFVPDAGLSDVEQKVFDPKLHVPPGIIAYPRLALQGFGVAMSLVGYQALQTAQGLNPADTTPGPNQPSLTIGQITSMVADSGGLAAAQADWSQVIPGSTKQVSVCRRVNSSGSQQSSNLFFLGKQCNTGSLGGALDPAPGNSGIAVRGSEFWVSEGAGTADVKACLNAATANDYAVGVMSLEHVPGGADNWRFVRINAISPNFFRGVDSTQIRTLVENLYPFGYESIGFGRTATGKDFMDRLKTAFGDISIGPLTGIAVAPGVKFYTDDPTQVAKATRNGNSCLPYQDNF